MMQSTPIGPTGAVTDRPIRPPWSMRVRVFIGCAFVVAAQGVQVNGGGGCDLGHRVGAVTGRCGAVLLAVANAVCFAGTSEVWLLDGTRFA